MPDSLDNRDTLRQSFIASIIAAHERRAELASVEVEIRAFAHALRTAGIGVEAALAEVKALLREHTGPDVPRFMPSVVGWMIAGYYYGYEKSGESS